MVKSRGEKNFVFSMPSRGSSIISTYEFKWRSFSLLSRQNRPPSSVYFRNGKSVQRRELQHLLALRRDCLLLLNSCLLYSRSPSLDSRFRRDDWVFLEQQPFFSLSSLPPSLFFTVLILICCRWVHGCSCKRNVQSDPGVLKR